MELCNNSQPAEKQFEATSSMTSIALWQSFNKKHAFHTPTITQRAPFVEAVTASTDATIATFESFNKRNFKER
jgi:hypothetical protein